ncbi:hypothetical protein [Salinarimonas rosea]|uniref:hypothetical protein n=1 Tax=Salinarimonas rosea TaxID=552063 RepID=UPI0009FD8EF4|nr:hypothetical protein [Salinarimonas rosea]
MAQPPPSEDPRPAGPETRPEHSAERVRQGEIVLRSRRRKAIFFGGLVALVLFAMIWTLVVGAVAG